MSGGDRTAHATKAICIGSSSFFMWKSCDGLLRVGFPQSNQLASIGACRMARDSAATPDVTSERGVGFGPTEGHLAPS
jgi:hypothetical protein